MAEHIMPSKEPGGLEAMRIAGIREKDMAESAESGQGLVEYGLIIFLVAIVVIAVLLLVGPRIGSIFSQLTTLPGG